MVRRRTRKLTKGPVQNFAGASEPLQDLGQDLHIAPQRERSDAREVLRGLREPCQNSHRAKTRAIPGAQNAERVARAISKFAPRFNESDLTCTWPRERLAGAYGRFSQDIAHATKKGHGKCKKNLGFGHLLVEAYKVLRLSQKMSPRHLKCCTCHTELIISKIKDDNSFKRRPCSPHTVPATNNDLQNHLWLRPANAFATSRKCHAWRADEKCPMSHAMQNSVSDFKMSRSATPATRNGHSHRP